MKGFMFSIEMLGTISLVMVVIFSMGFFSYEEIAETSIFGLKTTHNSVLRLYSGGDSVPVLGAEIDNIYCKKFADFDTDINVIVEKKYCEEIG